MSVTTPGPHAADPDDPAPAATPAAGRRPTPTLLVALGCLAALTAACYGRALFRGEQFAYRDAAHYYYPLNLIVQQQWDQGRWPLWEPQENGGMPLMGNPTAAVLYPGKIVFGLLSYPWAARVYVIGHTLLAFAAMVALARHWRLSATASTLAGLAYAFSGPVLFQYCNVIYLVGAAWVPLGFLAADRWVRGGSRRALLGLAVVLAMEVLGGEPEAAYLTGVFSAGYAAALAWGRARAGGGEARRSRLWVVVPAVLVVFTLWVAGTLLIASLTQRLRPDAMPPVVLPWMPWVAPAVATAWAVTGLALLNAWRRGTSPTAARLVPALAGLVFAAGLGAALSAAQLGPVLEYTRQSGRAAAGEGPHDVYPFSLVPWRVVEFAWPNVFGTPMHGNKSWLPALPPRDKSVKVWVPTLYVGAITAVLALAAVRLRPRGGPAWPVWMTAVAVLSLVGSFGEFSGPLFFARYFPEVRAAVGPHDPYDVAPIRFDHYLRDGDGGFYWFLSHALPGFRQFRFPSKLLTFTVMAVAALAGLGWDELLGPDRRRARAVAVWAGLGLLASLAALGAAEANRAALLAWLGGKEQASPFGPLDPPGAFAESRLALIQAAVVFAVAVGLAWRGWRRPTLAAAVALVALTADLAVANARYVVTVPQSDLDQTPEVFEIIRKAEAGSPSPGPYRVHRVPLWNPPAWIDTPSEDRVRDFVRWERGTLQPKYGIELGLDFTMTLGVAELYDYEFYFGGFPRRADAALAKALNVPLDEKVIYYPRRSYDLWTTRYFVLPYLPRWTDEHRGIAAFLDQTTRIHPPLDAFSGPGGRDREVDWVKNHDYQVRLNQAVYPRAWVVHSARYHAPLGGLTRGDRDRLLQEILFANDAIWRDPTRTVYDPRAVAWVSTDDRPALAGKLPEIARPGADTVKVVKTEPDRVELEADLEIPGLVVLADVWYPGWTLTIDGQDAPVYRTNLVMRGAAVPSGKHRLVYTFRPRTFRVGLAVSSAALGVLALLGIVFTLRPVSPAVADLDP